MQNYKLIFQKFSWFLNRKVYIYFLFDYYKVMIKYPDMDLF